MKQETKSSMIPSILNDSKKQEQTSLEKGMNTFDEQSKDLEDYNDKTLTWTDFRSLSRMSIIVALVDQKAKIRKWLLTNCKRDGFCILNKEGLKEFEEL